MILREILCMPLVEIKDFNALIGNKLFLNQPIKANKKRMKNLSNYHEIMIIQQGTYQITRIIKTINTNRQQQINTTIPQQINFTGKLEEDDVATMFF